MPHLVPIEIRFWKHVDLNGPIPDVPGINTPCWVWTAARNKGYGSCYVGQRNGQQYVDLAHRVAFRLQGGVIPKGLQVLHRCDNPLCVRREHMVLGTRKENMEQMVRHGRSRKGRLSPREVRSIRSLRAQGVSGETIATAFGFSAQAIWNITTGKSHVDIS